MKNSRFIKRLVVGAMAIAMSMSMFTGCSNGLSKDKDALTKEGGVSKDKASSTKVMVIGDEDIYMDEVLFYALQNLVMNKGTEEAVKQNPSTYKDGTISLIRTTKILYDVAEHNNVELTEEEKANTQTTIDNFKANVPQALLDKYGISDEVITRAFTEQACVTKFENDIRNEMATNAFNDIKEKCKDYNFVEIKYVLFPTVEADANNAPAKDADGNYIYLSVEEQARVKENVEKFIQDMEAGSDLDEMLASYGVADYSQDMSGYVGSFSEKLNNALEGAEAGKCSEILEDTLGYLVLYVKSDHNQDLLESYAYVVSNDVIEQEFNSLETQWLSTVEVDEENDMEGTVWADYDLINLAIDLETNGLITK